ncbi:MAG TPA: COX15/CtaA family protein [Candidatus Acidoferrum sp.]|nr:COX15/CtaA family protein [Candidatus Acidoferrum sp.]
MITTTYRPGVYRFAVFVFLWTVLLFVAGALVTSNAAALSVPDWPKSFGTWFPTLKQLVNGAFFEHSHRVIAGVLGVLLLIETVVIWLKDERKWMRWFALTAVGGVVVQSILGGEVVRKLLQYWLPVLHACFAQIMFGAILCLGVFTSKWWIEEHKQLEDRGGISIHTLALLNAIVMFVQVFFGAAFRHQYAAIWPHLVGSVVVLGMMIWTAGVLRRRFDDSPELTFARTLLHSMVGMQLLLGVAAYWSRLATADAPQPMPVMVSLTVIHTVFGALVFASSILVVLMCYRLVPRRGAVAVTSSQPHAATE